ncbi:MAG: DUF1570 domain-containing protein [Candidatus Gorgyraea atricola]|nr:DUF1570 domain-containing protein [Candidatus Gorgyraea atricola]
MEMDSTQNTKKKKIIAAVILLAIFIGAGYFLFTSGTAVKLYKHAKFIMQKKLYATEEILEYDYKDKVALHFRDGSTMIGGLAGITKDAYHIDWKGEEIIVYLDMVDRITPPKEALKEKTLLSDEEISEHWPFKNDVVIRLNNRSILDAKIDRVDPDKLYLSYATEGGGSIEQDIERSEIQYLIFKPVDNEESRNTEDSLKRLFPEMEFYKDGNFTIVTDSYITWVKRCRKVLRKTYTDIYLEFFDIFKDREPKLQNFVVIFDDYVDFVEYAVSDGVPGWAAAGYFTPEDKVLYLFNVLGDRFAELLFEGIVGESGRQINQIVDAIETRVDKRYHIYVEGRAKKIKNKFWKVYNYYENMFINMTMSTLRHEFTHELFHNWGLQNITLSRFKGPDKELIKRKKAFLEEKDYKKKAKVLKKLLEQKSEDVPLDMKAANSWLSEGMATYCEPDELGAQNDRRLFIYQEMTRKGPVYPLEFLTAYKMGSFPGVYSRAMRDMYAQSWAFVSFLMKRYPKEFMEYQNRLAGETAKYSEDINWLLEALGKDSKTIEREFAEYMAGFEELEDPFLIRFDVINNAFKY